MNVQSNMALTPRKNPFTLMNIKEEYRAITSARTIVEDVRVSIKNALRNHNTRHQLSHLSDRHLKDIGLTRGQARSYRKSIDVSQMNDFTKSALNPPQTKRHRAIVQLLERTMRSLLNRIRTRRQICSEYMQLVSELSALDPRELEAIVGILPRDITSFCRTVVAYTSAARSGNHQTG